MATTTTTIDIGTVGRGIAAGVVAVLALGITACGDDDTAAGERAVTDTTQPARGATTSPAAFCDAALTLETAAGPDVNFPEATDEEIADAAKAWGAEVLRPLADEVVSVAPAAIAPEIEVLSEVVDEVRETGDISAFATPDAAAALDAYLDFAGAECGWRTMRVGGVDYGFEGIPSEVDAGPTRVVFTNEGNELHELFLFRRNDGADRPVEELLSLPDDEVAQLLTPVGVPAFAPPGVSEQVVYDLGSGSYIAVCFIPVGITSEDAVPPPGAVPHAAHGMVAEFTVGS